MTNIAVRPGPKELLARMANARLYEEATKRGMTLSRLLEIEDPSSAYPTGTPGSGLDAFERLMQAAGIVTRSDPAGGIMASQFEAFDQSDATRSLVPEWIARIQRRVVHRKPSSVRAPFMSDDMAANTALNRPFYASGVRADQIAPQIPISELVAQTTMINSNSYKTLHLDDNPGEQRYARVGQGAEFSRVKLTLNEQEITLYKFGRLIEITYEALRRVPLDLVEVHVARVAVQLEVDKLTALIDIAVNGDGNSGTAGTETEITTLDAAATSNVPTLRGWMAFKTLFANPYSMNVALANQDMVLELMLLNSGSANIPLAFLPGSTFGQFTPINPQLADGVRVGITADAPDDKIIGFDRRFAFEQVIEIGSDISETVRWVHRQVQGLTLSETSGFAVMDANAIRLLDAAN